MVDMSVFRTTASNGAIDFHGEPAIKSKTGAWKAAPFIIVNEVAERMAFFAIVVSLKTYLSKELNMALPEAAAHTTDWVGASHFLTIVGAFIADAYLGRYLTIVVFSCIYTIGMSLLTFSASDPDFRPRSGVPATTGQYAILFVALGIIAFGTGGIKPCVSTFGADQFDEKDEMEARQKYSFFNWFFFAINLGAVFGILSTAFLMKKFGWGTTFGLPAVMSVVSLAVFVSGNRLYRYQRPTGSALTRFAQVLVAAYRNHKRGVVPKEGELYEVNTMQSDIVGARKLQHSDQYRFLDKAAVVTDVDPTVATRWKLCTVTQVEELKSIVRLFPIFFTTIALSLSFSQMSTFFISQAAVMDRKIKRLNNYETQPGTVLLFGALSPVVVVPIYAKVVIPILRKITGHRRGITSLQRMGVGLFITIVAMAVAAVVERKCRERTHAKVPVSWLYLQTFLIGAAEVFTYVGQLEFFYDQATDGTRSMCSAFFLVESGLGHWLSTIIVKIVARSTGGEHGWLRNDLDASRLDQFYWLLTGINAVNLVAYIIVSSSYKGRTVDGDGVAGKVKWDEEEGSSRRILEN